MVDTFGHVAPGQPLRIPARTWNALMDDARRSTLPSDMFGSGSLGGADLGPVIWIKNTSGGNLDRFSVVGIDGIVIDPADNLAEFKRVLALQGTTPAAGRHDEKFAVLAEPVIDGRLGRAWVTGVCVVQVNMTAAAHGCATITDADATMLTSAPTGPARILYVESGTGTKWAVVRLGASVKQSMWTAKVVAMYDAGGSAWTDLPTDNEYPAYCTANPCVSDGSSVDTGTTIYVGLNTKADSPNGIITAAAQIIGYVTGDGVKAYATHKLTGQAVLGFGCWIDWTRARAGV